MRRASLCCGLLACVSVFLVGCGGGAKGFPQEGTVEYEGGKPVEKASISFIPEGAGGQVASGQVRNGKFKLQMEGEDQGCLPGKYKVTISAPMLSMEEGPPPSVDAGDPSMPAPEVPAHSDFATKEKTPLSVEVTGPKTDHKFTVRPAN